MSLARTVVVLVTAALVSATSVSARADQRTTAGQRHRGSGGPARGPHQAPLPGPYPGPVLGPYPGPVLGPYAGPVYRGPGPHFARPYYHFRPRVPVSSGLWLGFAVPFPTFVAPFLYNYPYSYSSGFTVAPYGYANPYPAPYAVPYPAPTSPARPIYPPATSLGYPALLPPSGNVIVNGAPAGEGGISLEITPRDAEVWVDGGFAGRAEDFDPQRQPLTLAAGVHRIELRAPGFVTSVFDVTITPGYVLPYQGSLQP